MFRHVIPASALLLASIALTGCSEKQLLTKTLDELREALPGSESDRDIEWLRMAIERWQPTTEDEAKGLRQSLQLMLATLRRWPDDANTMLAVAEDLRIKSTHCLERGLAAEPKVEVRTKRQGLEEVKGLEVWYLEKFLASDPTAAAHRFKLFSSPVIEPIVPGRYVFWSKDPASGKVGQKVEQRIGLAEAIVIEVLAP
jgi:hypothetical protein